MTKLLLALIVLTFSSLSFAASQSSGSNTQTTSAAPGLNEQCAFTFTSGHDESFLKFCVTTNGNIIQLETPRGHEHLLFASTIGEGYGLCDTAGIDYSDYADFGDSGNWNPATVVSQDPKSVKIARTTSDGLWTLTQTFRLVAGTPPSVGIDMTVTNNSDIERDLILFRYANINADGLLQNNLDATRDSTFAWNSTDGDPNHPHGFGLMLQNAASTPFHHFGFILKVPDPPKPCNAFINAIVGPITHTDGSGFVDYLLPTDPHESKTVSVAYKGM